MTNQRFEPVPLAIAPKPLGVVRETMDEAIEALSVFDADRLETIQEQLRGLTSTYLARELAEGREAMPELLRKHTLLGEMLNATAANLRVVTAVLEARRTRISPALDTGTTIHDRSNLVPWPR